MSVPPALRPSRASRLACLAFVCAVAAIPRDGGAQDTVAMVVLPDSSLPARPAPDTIGADVAVIYPDSLPEMPRTMSELLAGRVAGLFVQRSSGAAGAASWISMRDAGAVHALEPLVVVDGVRRASTPPSINFFGPGPANTLDGERLLPSALDDIPVDQVERVEILRGPAAAARFGRDARYGVIVVTTRRPVGGRPQLRASVTGGLGSERADFPINHVRLDASGNVCTSALAASGYCTQVGTTTYSVLHDRNPFEAGGRRGARLDATAGLGIASFAFGATHDRAGGVLPMDGTDHTAVTARATVPFNSRVRLSASAQTSLRGVSQPAQGSSTLEIVSGGIYGAPIDCSMATPCSLDSISHGYRKGTPEYIASLGTHRRLQHFSEGAVLDMRATPWLTSQSSISYDGFANHGKRFNGPVPGYDYESVFRQEVVSHTVRSTLAQTLEATWSAARLQAATTLGVRSDRDRSHETTAAVSTANFNGNISTSGQWGGSSTRDRRTTARLEQRLSAGERVSGGAGVVSTHYTSRSRPPRPTLDGFADASVLLIDPAAATGGIRSLRLRAAAGQISGYDPRVLAQLAFVPIYVPPTPYPAEVKPLRAERAFELEGGVDAAFAAGNLQLSLTAYRRNDTDPYEVGPIIASTGFAVVGDLRRRLTGVELSAGMTVVDIERLRWMVQSQLALSGDRVTKWIWPQLRIGGGRGAYTVIEKGQSFGAWGSTPLTFADTNGNGIIEPQELTDPFASSQLAHAGHSRPTRTAGLQSSMLVLRAFTIGAQLDYAGGHKIINTAAVAQCFAHACVALNDPSASLVEQGRAVAAENGWINGYLEPGSTVRLRELSVSVQSARIAGLARSASVRFTLAGRNLATWSRYHGLDPDVDLAAPGIVTTSPGFLPGLYLPSTRQLTARLTLAY